jgi:DNA-binding GntR family transcriptional regulator
VASDAQGCARRLRANLDKQLPLVESCDLLGYSRLDFDFHSVIYEACGNGLLRELLDNIKYRSGPLVCDISPILTELYQDHLELVEAFSQVEAERAGEIMQRHNQRMRQCLQTYFGENLDRPPVLGAVAAAGKKTLKRSLQR